MTMPQPVTAPSAHQPYLQDHPAITAAPSWRVEVIADESAFLRLRDEWNELVQNSASNCLFLTWEWLHTWWTHLGMPQPAIVAVRRNRALVGLAPLFTRSGLVPQHELMGRGTIGSDYLDLVAAEEHRDAVLAEIADRLHRSGRPLVLEQVPAGGSEAAELMRLLQAMGWRRTVEVTNTCPYIDLTDHDWDSYLQTLSSSHRYNFRRRRRQLERDFEVELELVESEERRREALDTLIALHLERWQELGGSEAFGSRAVIDFHHDFTQRALRRGWLRLYVLKLDGRPAAAIYGMHYDDRFLFYQSGFDAEFGRYSVGMVLMGLTIRAAIAEGAREYDLLHGDEEYKFSWAKTSRGVARIEGYPPGFSGSVSLQRRRAAAASKRLLRSWLPEPLVAALARVRG